MTHSSAPVAVRIYTTEWCGFCHAAKRLFEHLGIDYEEISLDGDPELRWRVAAHAGNWPTVPMIFVGDRFIGGSTDAAALHRKGRLVPMCHADMAPEPTG